MGINNSSICNSLLFEISEKAKLSVGVKYVTSDFENQVAVSNNGVTLPNFTSTIDLTDNIFALYSQLDYQLSDKTTFKGGLLFEKSDTELNSSNAGT